MLFLKRRLIHDVTQNPLTQPGAPASSAFSPAADAGFRTFTLSLGAHPIRRFPVGLPVLAGSEADTLFQTATPAGRSASFDVYTADGWRLGVATAQIDDGASLERESRRLYEELLQAVRGQHLARIWNYVPAINARAPEGLENYHAFCRGRSLAFEAACGPNFKRHLPAASAVGTAQRDLSIVFAASPVMPRHVENPRQTPAYDYPPVYGPRPPSFARASVVTSDDQQTIFLSGTSAICGHATVAPFHTDEQIDCTLTNLREIATACGLGAELGANARCERRFRIYLRKAEDQPAVATALEAKLLRSTDLVSYLRADICRPELNVEIEVTLRQRS